MSTPAERFLSYYETCFVIKKFKLNEYLDQEFNLKSPVKYQVKFSSTPDILLPSLCNTILKNLDSNPFFRLLAEKEFNESEFMSNYGTLYITIKAAVLKINCDENTLPKFILLLHLSKEDLQTHIFEKCFRFLESLTIINSGIDKISEYVTELQQLYSKLIISKNLRKFSIETIRKINGSMLDIDKIDISKIKLVFFNDQILGLNGFSGADSIYVSFNGLINLLQNINNKLNTSSKMTIMKLNFVRLIQHELTHILLRGLADDMNVSTPDVLNRNNKKVAIQEPGVLSEIERFGGRIDWISSSLRLNIKICDDYLNKIETDQDDKFDLIASNVVLETSHVRCMALDMCGTTVIFE